jgi:hypothetical protein
LAGCSITETRASFTGADAIGAISGALGGDTTADAARAGGLMALGAVFAFGLAAAAETFATACAFAATGAGAMAGFAGSASGAGFAAATGMTGGLAAATDFGAAERTARALGEAGFLVDVAMAASSNRIRLPSRSLED